MMAGNADTRSPDEGAQRRNPGAAFPDYGAVRLRPGYQN